MIIIREEETYDLVTTLACLNMADFTHIEGVLWVLEVDG